jgi:hypothetical protein
MTAAAGGVNGEQRSDDATQQRQSKWKMNLKLGDVETVGVPANQFIDTRRVVAREAGEVTTGAACDMM